MKNWKPFSDNTTLNFWPEKDYSEVIQKYLPNTYEKIVNNRVDKAFDTDMYQRNVMKIFKVMNFTPVRINIHYVKWGTLGKFNDQTKEIHIFPRVDREEGQSLKSVVGYVIRKIYPGKSLQEYVTIGDFFVNKLDILEGEKIDYYEEKKILDPKLVKKVEDESYSNYLRIGFPPEQKVKLTANSINLNGNNITDLTISEKKVLKQMIDKKFEICTYYELGDILWSSSENYSLEALNKTIERIRHKLKDAGMQKNVILTKRGEGYCFVG